MRRVRQEGAAAMAEEVGQVSHGESTDEDEPKRGGRRRKGVRKAASVQGMSLEETSFTLSDVELEFHENYQPMPKGSPYGFLYRNFTTLHQYTRLFYMLDLTRSMLIEFEDDRFMQGKSSLTPRAVFDLQNARLEDDPVWCQVNPSEALYFWKLFIRQSNDPNSPSSVSSKTLTIGAKSEHMANLWLVALRPVVGSGNGFLHDSRRSSRNDLAGLENGSEVLSPSLGRLTPSLRSPSGSASAYMSVGSPMPEGPAEWKQPIRIFNEVFHIPCTGVSTNAWLLSEAIRAYIRRHGCDPEPELTALFNSAQHCTIDLSDDAKNWIFPGDTLEAICSSPVALYPSSGARKTAGQILKSASQPILSRLSSTDSSTSATLGEEKAHKRIPSMSDVRRVSTISNNNSVAAGLGFAGMATAAAVLPVPDLLMLGKLIDVEELTANLQSTGHFLEPLVERKARIFKQLEIVCKAMANPVFCWPSKEWVGATHKQNNVQIYTSSTTPGTLGIVTVKGSPEQVLEKVLDIKAYHEWNPCIKQANYLVSGFFFFYFFFFLTDITHLATKK